VLCQPAFPLVSALGSTSSAADRSALFAGQQMLARNWHDDAISSELGSFCQKSHLIAGLIYLS
jgi:hypothetical protein